MTIMPAPSGRVTAGVDTHGESHVVAALDSVLAVELGHASFATTPTGYRDLRVWLERHGMIDRVGIESTGSWGAGLARSLAREGIAIVEVDRPDRTTRRNEGKSDPTDAYAAARSVISGRSRAVPKSQDGLVEAIRAVEVACHGATKDRTRAINQFKALVVTAPETLREQLRRLPFSAQLDRSYRFPEHHDDVVMQETRIALKELARRIAFLDTQIARLEQRMTELTVQAAPALVGMFAVGPHVAAQLLAAVGDNPHRMTSEARFAKLCGACPIPASSGKTQRHRLNRGGDRRANNALHTIVLVRMRFHNPTRVYVERRRSEGKTTAEITRCLKRFVAREVYQTIMHPAADLVTGTDVRTSRTERGLTQIAVAAGLGVNHVAISRLERGITHDTHLARRAHDWILQQDA